MREERAEHELVLTGPIAPSFALVASVAGLGEAAWAAISDAGGERTYFAEPLPLATLYEGDRYMVRLWGPGAIWGRCEGDARGDRLGGRGIATERRGLRSRRRRHSKTQIGSQAGKQVTRKHRQGGQGGEERVSRAATSSTAEEMMVRRRERREGGRAWKRGNIAKNPKEL